MKTFRKRFSYSRNYKVVLLRPALVWVEETHIVEAEDINEATNIAIKRANKISYKDIKNNASSASYKFPKKVSLGDLLSEKAFIGARRADFIFKDIEELRDKMKLSETDIDIDYLIVDESKSKLI